MGISAKFHNHCLAAFAVSGLKPTRTALRVVTKVDNKGYALELRSSTPPTIMRGNFVALLLCTQLSDE